MKDIRFKNRIYTFQETIQTQISDEYVPDWGLFHAIRESLQNLIDETLMCGKSGYGFSAEKNPDRLYCYDSGRGVEFKDILYLGVSGKRGVDGVVGQHGEGEVVSTMVAARLGVKKLMASQNWLVTGRLEPEGKYNLLVIDYYETLSPRKGTAWYYEGPNVCYEAGRAREVFKPPTHQKGRLISGSGKGTLYTNGLKVNRNSSLYFGYNLTATPGRDRSGFVLDGIKEEAIQILNRYAGVDEIASLLKQMASPWWKPVEAKWDLDLDPELVQKAARKVTKSRKRGALSWWSLGEGGTSMADAVEQGMMVMSFEGPVPNWVSRALPNTREVVGAKMPETIKNPPKSLDESLTALKEVMRVSFEQKCVYKFEDASTIACTIGKTGTVIFSRFHIRKHTFVELIDTVAHEAAHLISGSADCTRSHTAMIAQLLSQMSNRLVLSVAARDTYLIAAKRFEEYIG